LAWDQRCFHGVGLLYHDESIGKKKQKNKKQTNSSS